ncbi:MAG: type II toxin-antitoxin system RelE/ParE family toxin [Cyclobacteriaceae bacterium]
MNSGESMADRRIIWSLESSTQIQHIKENILVNWSEKEVNLFLGRLRKFEKIVFKYPYLYPRSLKYPNTRKAVISKHNSVIYQIEDDVIRILTILINRQENE